MFDTEVQPRIDGGVYSRREATGNVLRVMERQNTITEMLVQQQQMSCLPQRDIPVFTENALEFKSLSGHLSTL